VRSRSAVALTWGVALVAVPVAESALPTARVVTVGHSVEGRPIVAVRVGDRDAPRKALVVGVIHGDEDEGLEVTRILRRRYRDIDGVDLWLIDAVNPDGLAAGTRKNAHGVDLNRNWSVGWSGAEPYASGYYAGPRPFSEPETRAVRDLLLRLKPRVTIWYHQPWGAVLAPCNGPARLETRYSQISGLRLDRCRGEGLPGTATRWQERTIDHSQAFVVEFPGGEISERTARRHAHAAAVIAQRGARRIRLKFPLRGLRPRITQWRIPFGARRMRQMSAYSQRHYGRASWRLTRVLNIVEHYAVTDSARAVWNTFAPDRPDPEFGELPGTCAHFVINGRGRIFQLVRLDARCRHAGGLNHVSIGIEHTGFSDAQVMSDRRQLNASLRLSRWLRCRFRVPVRRVIGHREVPASRFYREHVARFRNYPPHGDFRHATMERYRAKLAALGGCPNN
jgi:zinc carboxypeptidase/N-acetylmuramoyl-L-alanine amidase-like protein